MATSSPKDNAHSAAPAWTHGRATHQQQYVIPMPGGVSSVTISGSFPMTPDSLEHLLVVLNAMSPGITVPADEVERETSTFRADVAAALQMSPDEPDAELLRSLHQLAD